MIAVVAVGVADVAVLRSHGFGGDAMVDVCKEKRFASEMAVESQMGSGFPVIEAEETGGI